MIILFAATETVNNQYKKIKKGFTLIELLVVITIISILTSFGVARYQTSEKQARDTRRKSDLGQYRIALENFASINRSLYPTPAGSTCVDILSLCSGDFKDDFIPACPDDPRKESDVRFYQYCGSSTQYSLSSKLEISSQIWQICSSGVNCQVENYPESEDCSCP